ncbi:hypothetical protein [uncultured Thiodictyon sp.]|uniref:hypothetical protein n=1 Tax=uncultured Thiodictyon sp. TaxID=1846217 RepID=UPI0025DE1264|nr:hypothetical protein [uncultured Thiodictyon sp.]
MPILIIVMVVSNQVGAQSKQEIGANRNQAECSARSTFIQLSIDVYSSQARGARVRSQQGAVDYVIEQTINQNLKKKESEALIRRIVKYVYDVLRPSVSSPGEIVAIKDAYERRCMFDPEKEVGDFYVVDLEKAFSKNTEGKYIIQNKDGSNTICHKGECKSQQPEPPQNIGKAYEETRRVVESLHWTPAPLVMRPILIKMGRLSSNGKKFINNEIYGNCLTENLTCDKSKPELADCTEDGKCTAVWAKNGATIWYVVQNGLIAQFGSAPENFAK